MIRKFVALSMRVSLFLFIFSFISISSAESGWWNDFWCLVELNIATSACVDAAPFINYDRCVKEATCDYKRCVGKKDPTCDGIPAAPSQQMDWARVVDSALLTARFDAEIIQRFATIDTIIENQPIALKDALVKAGMSKQNAQGLIDEIVTGIKREKKGNDSSG